MRKTFVVDVTVIDGSVLINLESLTVESFAKITWNNFLYEKEVCHGWDCDWVVL